MADNDQRLPDVSLENIRGGAAIEMFDHELQRVVENIADLNTDAEATRKVVLTVTIKPNATRDDAVYLIGAEAKLAPPRAVPGHMYIGKRHGKPVAVSWDPAQHDMFGGDDPDVVPLHQKDAQGGEA